MVDKTNKNARVVDIRDNWMGFFMQSPRLNWLDDLPLRPHKANHHNHVYLLRNAESYTITA